MVKIEFGIDNIKMYNNLSLYIIPSRIETFMALIQQQLCFIRV